MTDTDKRVSRTFSKVESVVRDYTQLLTGKGFDFYALPNPHDPVAGAKPPLIPMIISVIPPEVWPTGEVGVRQVSFPGEQEIALTSFRERFIDQTGLSRSITQIVPTDPERARQVDDLTEQVLGLEERISKRTPADPILVAQRNELSRQIDLLLAETRFTEVEVPLGSTASEQRQREQVSDYLQGVKERYRTFQEASVEARSKLRDRQSITGPLRRDERDTLGQQSQVSQARSLREDVEYIRNQALKMLNLPPLFMYVNPDSWQKAHAFIVSDGNKTREKYVVEFWGEQQVKITASGKVGAFYVDKTDGLGRKAGGLAVSSRKGSYAYQQFMALFQAYRSNGYIYNSDRSIALVGSIALFYDGVIYTGSFDNLSITHSEDSPFTFDYNFSFTVRFEQQVK